MHAAALLTLFSVLIPLKGWFGADQPLSVQIKSDQDIVLVLTDFGGRAVESRSGDTTIAKANSTVDLHAMFAAMDTPGTYVLFAVPVGKSPDEFIGTPLVVEVREDHRTGAPNGVMVRHVSPLRYATLETDAGTLTAVMYYDAAPNSVANFLRLIDDGFYDGLTFHRVVPGFIIQGGDPRGDGSGGPGYQVDAEFTDRPQREGVLSMARQVDPNEASGASPRPQFANSAGSQFFICLDYAKTKTLDGKYSAFGVLVDGMDTIKKIAAAPLADPATGRPEKPVVIRRATTASVTPDHNPYLKIMHMSKATPTTQP